MCKLSKFSLCVVPTLALAILVFGSTSASASGFTVDTHTIPAHLQLGGRADIEIDLFPLGETPPEGTITVTDTLPSGVTALEAGDLQYAHGTGVPFGVSQTYAHCGGSVVVRCTIDPSVGLPYFDGPFMRLEIVVEVEPGASGTAENRVMVSGGGAPEPASTTTPITISSSPSGFGFDEFDAVFGNANGTIDTQAGSHPYEAIFSFTLNTRIGEDGNGVVPTGEARDLTLNLPPGLIGDPHAAAQCTQAQLAVEEGSGGCPPASQVGITMASSNSGILPAPVYNMVPPPGAPAEFGFDIFKHFVSLVASPRTGTDGGITVHADDVVQGRTVYEDITRIWGVPGDPSHDHERGEECLHKNYGVGGEPAGELKSCPLSGASLTPLLTLPTQCAGPPTFSIGATSWNGGFTAEASVPWHDSQGAPTGITGCEPLHFEPAFTDAPDTSSADTPAGLTAEVTPPTGGLLEPEGLSTADLQGGSFTLPEGLVINPGQAAGLQSCQLSESGIGTENAPECPAASKVGTDEVETPLLTHPLKGSIYVLPSEPPHVLLLFAFSGEGVNVKVVGRLDLNEATGQVTARFGEDAALEAEDSALAGHLILPQLPFTNFKSSFSGGAQAALVTPTGCGAYTTSAEASPWSSPFVADFATTSVFAIDSGPGGSPCPSTPLPFTPSMIAGATTDQAGGYTDFSLLLSRADGQQRISKLQFKAPVGLLGMISHVSLCEEPQASKGECPASSQIGHTVVGAGAGSYPLYVPEPGRPEAPIYVTGPYEGAPYGLSIAVPVIAGPFNLGTTVVRGRIEVNSQTAQLTITTDPLPVILDGVPVDMRTINAVVDRKEFMFNPTNCNPQAFSGTATSVEGATAALSSPFQVGSCRSLGFKPTFQVSTSAKTSRTQGASLHVSLTLPDEGGLSSEANVQRVKVSLPKQLPTPLKTLQKACLEKTFAENPKNCPVASQVGQVKVSTPVLPGGLTGTAYFVSHGGAKYPELIMVLVGQNGVTVQVHGETQISKAGITTATFNMVPDVPFSDFELELPQREYPALTANGNLCKGTLIMPTEMAGQNGLVINQSTKISVTGCPKSKKAAHRKKAKTHGKGKGKGKKG
jgi:hypothetical protein